MRAVQRDDRNAFDALYTRHQQWVYSYLRRMTDDAAAAADLRQEVFLRVWRDRARWTPTGSMRGYLVRIARRLAVDEARRLNVRRRWASAQVLQRGTARSPDEVLAEARVVERVHAAIADLPERMREVFVLKRDAGLSYLEIAQRLGVSPKTVDVQMTNALRRLRRALSDLLS